MYFSPASVRIPIVSPFSFLYFMNASPFSLACLLDSFRKYPRFFLSSFVSMVYVVFLLSIRVTFGILLGSTLGFSLARVSLFIISPRVVLVFSSIVFVSLLSNFFF